MKNSLHEAVLRFINPTDLNRPCGQDKSYYANSSWSGLEGGFDSLLWHFEMKGLVGLGTLAMRSNPALRDMCGEIEKYFVVGTMASAVYDAMSIENGTAKREQWFHEPFWGAYTTVNAVIELHTQIGRFDTGKKSMKDKAFSKPYAEYKKVWKLYQASLTWDEGQKQHVWNEGKKLWVAELPRLHQVHLQSLETIRNRIKQALEAIPKPKECLA